MNSSLESLPVLVLYPHARCNCRCVMCDIWKADTSDEISAVELERHLSDIERLHVEWMVFSGGEPLMHSDLFRLADLARSRGIRTTMLSTGLLLGRFAQGVARAIDDVIVSLDGPQPVHDAIRRVPGAFDLLAKGVCAVKAIHPGYEVSARSTVQRGNALMLRKTVQAAREIGMKSISFLAVDVAPGAFERVDERPDLIPAREDLPALEAEIEELIAEEGNRKFVLETPAKLRRILHRFRASYGLEESASPPCNAPWVSAVVETDGTVRPCFFHPPIGNIRCDSLAEVINGPRALEFRANLRIGESDLPALRVLALQNMTFDAIAARYDELWTRSPIGRLQRDAVWRRLDELFRTGDKLLDLGCGTGEDALHFMNRGVEVAAIDASSEMVRVAHGRGVNASAMRIEEAGRIPGCYDGVISNFGALNCVENLGAIRDPLSRLVRSGGHLAICIMGRFCLWETVWYTLQMEPRKAVRRWKQDRTPALGVQVFYPSIRHLRRILRPDFELLRWYGVGIAVPPSYVTGLSGPLLNRLAALDRRIDHVALSRALSDHRLIIFRRT